MIESFTVYGLIDPRDRQIHYVGVSREVAQRVRAHVARARGGRRGDTARGREWYASLAADKALPEYVVLQVVLSDYAGALAAEKRWIDLLLVCGAPLVTRGAGNGHLRSRRRRASARRALPIVSSFTLGSPTP